MSRVTLVLKTNEGGMWALPQITELMRRGVEVTTVVPPGNGRLRAALDTHGYPVVDAPFDFSFRPTWRTVRSLFSFRRVLRDTKPDVLFYHLYASALATRLASIGLGAKRVHMVAGPLYLEDRRIRLVERLMCHLDDHLIAGSDFTRRAYGAIGMPAQRLSTVPYGVDTSTFVRGTDQRQGLLGVDSETFVVIMVAYVYAPKSSVFPGVGIKGHDVLLDAWSEFRARHPRSLLVLVGSGFDAAGETHRTALKARYAIPGDPTIRWFDSVDDVRPLYSSADLSVSPSLSENHGAALEASSMGLPSVVSDAGGLPEAVREESGWVVPAGDRKALLDALERASEERAAGSLRERGEHARSLMEREFDSSSCVRRTVDTLLSGVATAVAAFTEQRSWLVGGLVYGRKELPIVSALAKSTSVVLASRIGRGEPGGVPLAPEASAHAIPWPSGKAVSKPVQQVWSCLASVNRAVAGSRVVYADQPGIVGGIALALGALRGRDLVVNVVGDSAESVHPSVVPGLKGRVAHALLPRLQAWSCAHATYVNYVTAQVLQDRYPARRAQRTFSSSTADALGPPRPRHFVEGDVSVVTIASLEQPYKGVTELIEAVAKCRHRGIPMTLTVIGEGRLRAQFEALAGSALPGAVTFTGQLYHGDLYEELGRHDVFALASWTEGLPRALVEAMADGMPAVATDVGGVSELLEPHRLAPPRDAHALADKLIALCGDEEAWRRSVMRNQAAAERLISTTSELQQFVDAVAMLSRGVERRRDA